MPEIITSQAINSEEFQKILSEATLVDVVPGADLYNRGNYDFYIATPEGKTYDITALVESCDITFGFNQPYVQCDLSVVHSTQLRDILDPPNWIIVYGPYWNNSDIPNYTEFGPTINPDKFAGAGRGLYQEIEEFQITTLTRSSGDEQSSKVVGKTNEWILAKNRFPTRLPQGTLHERLIHIAQATGMNYIEDISYLENPPTYVLPPTRAGNDSVWDDIMYDLGETNRIEDRKFVLRQRRGVFYLHEIERQNRMWLFELGANIIDLSINKSIEKYFNTVYVVTQTDSTLNERLSGDADEDPTSIKQESTGYAAAPREDIERFGLHILTTSESLGAGIDTSLQQAEYLLKKANKIHQEGRIKSYSLNGMRWGDQIIIHEPSQNMYGVFWVRGGRHTIASGIATMELDISFEYVAPEAIRALADPSQSSLPAEVVAAASE